MVTTVTVYDGTISRMIKIGEVDRWAYQKARRFESEARIRAPKRSGRLAESHRTQQNRARNGRFETGYHVDATAPHAIYVLRGTGIYGPRGRIIDIGKPMGPIPGPGPRFIRTSRGQQPNDWLSASLPAVL